MITFFKPEFLCVAFIGLFHNVSLLYIVTYYSIQWSFALGYAINGNNHPNKEHYEYQGLTFTKGEAGWFMALHWIGTVFAALAAFMDISLRDSTNPVNYRQY